MCRRAQGLNGLRDSRSPPPSSPPSFGLSPYQLNREKKGGVKTSEAAPSHLSGLAKQSLHLLVFPMNFPKSVATSTKNQNRKRKKKDGLHGSKPFSSVFHGGTQEVSLLPRPPLPPSRDLLGVLLGHRITVQHQEQRGTPEAQALDFADEASRCFPEKSPRRNPKKKKT